MPVMQQTSWTTSCHKLDLVMENVLRECAERLIAAANGLSTSTTAPTGAHHTSTTTGATATTTPSRSVATTPVTPSPVPSALEEHRRIFGFRPPVGPTARRPSVTSRGARNSSKPYFVPKNTFTRAFVCLANTDQEFTPDASERIRLSCAGLGEAKVVFNKEGNAHHVHEKITETFPALGEAGGYELLRKPEGNSKRLIQIPHPPKGFTVQFLKAALGQAKAYLRPIQKNLVLDVQKATVRSIIII